MGYSKLFPIFFTVLNLIYYLNSEYIGTPKPADNLKAVLKDSFELKCQYINGEDGEFSEWFKDDIPISKEKPGHYVVKQNNKESILTIKIFVNDDANVKKWYVTTNKPDFQKPSECQFGPIILKPSPQGISTGRVNEKIDSAHGSIRRTEDEQLQLTCLVESPEDLKNTISIKWEFSKDDHTFTSVPDGITTENDKLIINRVQKSHRGYYRCTVNDVSFTVLLRVKDRFAALWPFIGIVSVVLVLVIIILIYEKRQKSNKKPVATDDDEQDQVNERLVQSTTKGSDNDNKKRTVKA